MNNIIEFKGCSRIAEALGCGACYGQDFSIVDDTRTKSPIIVCDTCGRIAGEMIIESSNERIFDR